MAEPATRLLLVEDDALVARALAQALARHVELVETVDSVVDALRSLDASRFDLIVTDYNLGAGAPTGLDLAQTLRARAFAVPIILVSGILDERLRGLAAAAGVDACLPKPCGADELLATLSRMRARAPA